MQDSRARWAQWCEAQLATQPGWLRRAVAALPEAERARWVMRLRNPRSPWLEVALERFGRWREAWVVTAGLDWAVAETETATFLAYPEALGGDPLALLGLGLVWAQGHDRRQRMVAERLGPLLAPVAMASAAAPWPPAWWAAYRQAYEDALHTPPWQRVDDWVQALAPHAAGSEPSVRWRPWPVLVERYLEQLRLGMVPHEAGGAAAADPDAVLLAGFALRLAGEAVADALLGKALEAISLYGRWRALADGRDREGR